MNGPMLLATVRIAVLAADGLKNVNSAGSLVLCTAGYRHVMRLLTSLVGVMLLSGAGAAGGDHWAYVPIKRPAVPPVVDQTWPRSDVDRFVLARLEAAGLRPAAEASAATLLRRVTFDLAGRPPTIEEQDAFLAAPDRAGWQAVVDRLLASPEFGERWGQHWLDVARFAESSGGGRSIMYPEAWRYRDYVIDALNRDQPFDRFIIEQLAGDQLAYENDAERNRHAIATGFLTLGAINYELQDKRLLEMEIVDEQIDAIGRAFLGLSLGCARCHDHKFDPISTEEYYGLAGIFTSTKSIVHDNVSRPMTVSLLSDEAAAQFRQSRDKIAALKKEDDALSTQQESAVDDAARAKLAQRRVQLKRDIESIEKEGSGNPVAMAVVDAEQPADTHIRFGGDAHHRGPLTPRSFLAVAGLSTATVDDQGRLVIAADKSGRLELARWIASPENRLTSRVIVNRVWHHLFGAGIVRTTDDFGVTGQPPTHPELLDHLATTFVDQGWSIKSLVRQLVLSHVYTLSSEPDDALVAADPENKLRGRASRRQLDGEALRDAMLMVSASIDPTRGGLTIQEPTNYDTKYQYQSRRRTIYLPRFRSVSPEAINTFGGGDANTVCGCRTPSILPAQALYLLNGKLVIESADHAANRLLTVDASDQSRIELLYRRFLGRLPASAEVELAGRYLQHRREAGGSDDSQTEQQAWSGLCQILFSSLDFRFLN